MDSNTFDKIFKKCKTEVLELNISNAINCLKQLAQASNNWEITSEYEQISSSYQLMLSYFAKGVEDEKRNSLYCNFILRIQELCNACYLNYYKDKGTSSRFFTTMKRVKNADFKICELLDELIMQNQRRDELDNHLNTLKADTESILLEKEHEKTYQDLFDTIWTKTKISEEEQEQITNFLLNPKAYENDKCLTISALTISCLFSFEQVKFQTLLNMIVNNEVSAKVKGRAKVGMILVFTEHKKEIKANNTINMSLGFIQSSPNDIKSLFVIQKQLINAQHTKTVNRLIKDEIIPDLKDSEILKSNKIDIKKIYLIFEKDDDLITEIDKKFIKDTENNIKKLLKMHKEGDDINASSFNIDMLPHFNTIANCFYPFDERNSSVSKIMKENGNAIKVLSNINRFCDLDIYSLCNTSEAASFGNKKIIDLIKEKDFSSVFENSNINREVSDDDISNYYIQDLYRALYLSQKLIREINPFDNDLIFWLDSSFTRCFNSRKLTAEIASYLRSKNGNEEAILIYDRLIDTLYIKEEEEYEFAYCLQKIGEFEKAASVFTFIAMTIEKEERQNDKMIKACLQNAARCYILSENYEGAIDCYLQIEKMEPDNAQNLCALGRTLIMNKEYKEAKNKLFKADYLCPNSIKTMRAIAWVCFSEGDLQKSYKYYSKLIETKETPEDFLNAGHVALALHQTEQAYELYKKFKDLNNGEISIQYFTEDEDLLRRYNVFDVDLRIMLDALNRQQI